MLSLRLELQQPSPTVGKAIQTIQTRVDNRRVQLTSLKEYKPYLSVRGQAVLESLHEEELRYLKDAEFNLHGLWSTQQVIDFLNKYCELDMEVES